VSAPEVRTAADVAELRSWMVRQWQPGGAWKLVSEMAQARAGRQHNPELERQFRQEAETERRGLQRSTLWYVEPSMVDLLLGVRPSCPEDVRPEDLVWPSDAGFVVFAKDVPGIAVDRIFHHDDDAPTRLGSETTDDDSYRNTTVRAIMWNRSMLPNWPDVGGPHLIPCLSVHSYRLVDFDDGLSVEDLNAAALLGELDPENPAVQHRVSHIEVHRADGVTSTTGQLHGSFWAPMGHSDWPIHHRLDERPEWCRTGSMWASFREDHQLVASLFTLLAEEAVAQRTIQRPARHVTKRAARLGIKTDDERSRVVVVNLRRPHVERDAEHEVAHTGVERRAHLVREHLRWQPVGPGRQERRLTVVRAHVRGKGEPVLKTKVMRWVR
jgi:hypothetical protein